MFFFRPPGHHSQRSAANGFCVFNNVAIAALYAKKHYNVKRLAYRVEDQYICLFACTGYWLNEMGFIFLFSRVLIVDWDVHHGQGVQYCFEEDPRSDVLAY